MEIYLPLQPICNFMQHYDGTSSSVDSSGYYTSRGKVRDTKEAIKRDVVVSLSRSQVTSSLVRVITHIFAMTVSRIRMTSYSIWVGGLGGNSKFYKLISAEEDEVTHRFFVCFCHFASLLFIYIYVCVFFFFFLGFNWSRSSTESIIITFPGIIVNYYEI